MICGLAFRLLWTPVLDASPRASDVVCALYSRVEVRPPPGQKSVRRFVPGGSTSRSPRSAGNPRMFAPDAPQKPSQTTINRAIIE